MNNNKYLYRLYLVITKDDKNSANNAVKSITGNPNDDNSMTTFLSTNGQLPHTHYALSSVLTQDWRNKSGLLFNSNAIPSAQYCLVDNLSNNKRNLVISSNLENIEDGIIITFEEFLNKLNLQIIYDEV